MDERTTLNEFLRCQRLTLQLKCDGLDAGQLARRAVEPSVHDVTARPGPARELQAGGFTPDLLVAGDTGRCRCCQLSSAGGAVAVSCLDRATDHDVA